MADGAMDQGPRAARGARQARDPSAPIFRDLRSNLGFYTVFILPKKEDLDAAAVAAMQAEMAGPSQLNGESPNQESPPEQPADGAENPTPQGPRAAPTNLEPEPLAGQPEPLAPEPPVPANPPQEPENPPTVPSTPPQVEPVEQPDIVPPLPPRPSTITFRFGAVQMIGRGPGAQPYRQVIVQHSPRPGEQPGLPPYPGVPAGVLTLTHEQLVEAHALFRNANRVSRPEKALILAFMAGSRENPCEHVGNILRIKLAECYENVIQPNHTVVMMLCETHFQMNYNNGSWSCLKMYRHVEGAIPFKIAPGA